MKEAILMKKIKFTVRSSSEGRKILDYHQYLKEVKRGTGAPKPKKGKGSYRRKKFNPKDY
jgi:hypothetical protein